MKKFKDLLFNTLCIALCIAVVGFALFMAYVKFMFYFRIAFG